MANWATSCKMSVASASFSAKMALSSANINLVADWSSVKPTVAIGQKPAWSSPLDCL